MQTNTPTSLNQYIKWLRNAVDKGHLYDSEEYYRIKKELHEALKVRNQLNQLEKAQRGFGYTYDQSIFEQPSETDLSDSTGGADDGVYSEGEQPSESGEPERSGTVEVLHQA
jgi:hypothetical protein